MMNRTTHAEHRGRIGSEVIAILVVQLLALGLAGCDSLLTLEAPARVMAENLDDPSNAALLVNGAVADCECALASYVAAFGLQTDELADAALSQSQFDFDRRTFTADGGTYASDGCGSLGVYRPVSTARYSADFALTRLDGWSDTEVPDRSELIAKAAAFAGYSYTLLGEGFCSAAVDGGPELTPADLFQIAEDRFSRAIELATDPAIENLARVGRARVRLNRGKADDAAADAQLVPQGFVYNANYNDQSARSRNWCSA